MHRSILLGCLLGLLLAPAMAEGPARTKTIPEDPDVSATYECVVRKSDAAVATAATVEKLRAVPGLQVTGSFGGVISLRLTPNQRNSVDVNDALQRECSHVFRSRTPQKPKPESSSRLGSPAQFDTQEAVKAMLLDNFLAKNPGINGAGVKIGIISDSFNVLGATDFPCEAVKDLTILKNSAGVPQEGPADVGGDEGRAMAELICFIAPKAKLYFWSGFNGYGAYAEGIVELQKAGCQVIVDDIGYANEPWYSPGLLTQAVDQVKAAGSAYFSAAGNSAGLAVEQVGRFAPSGALNMPDLPSQDRSVGPNVTALANTPAVFHNWQTLGGNPAWLKVVVGESLFLQWDEPFRTDTKGASGNPYTGVPQDGAIPFGNYYLAVQLVTGTRTDLRFKVYNFGEFNVLPGQSVTSGAATTCQHANTPSALSVGAANFLQTPGYGQNPALLEPYSSWGAQSVMYTATGERLTKPTVLLKPDLAGVDGTATSFFFEQDPEGIWRFTGTSAAAPNTAAVAALIIQQNPGISPDEVYAKLRAAAQDMFVGNAQGRDQPTAGPDRFTGYGFLNAGKALTQCVEGACCNNGMFKRDGAGCAWSGGDDSRFIADKSSLTHTASNSSPAASIMADMAPIKYCEGTCKAGICTITPRQAFCCFAPETPYDTYIASASPAKRRNRKHGENHGKTFHCWS